MRGVGAVLQVVPTGCRQGSIQLLGPFLVSPGKPKHPIRGEPEVTEHRPERQPRADRIQELLPHLDRKPLLRSGTSPGSLGVAMRPRQRVHLHPAVPAGRRAMPCLTHHRNASGSLTKGNASERLHLTMTIRSLVWRRQTGKSASATVGGLRSGDGSGSRSRRPSKSSPLCDRQQHGANPDATGDDTLSV
jgi:hypothetical protein